MGRILQCAQCQGNGIADEHALEDKVGGHTQENGRDGPVGHSHGLEGADGGDIPEQEYEKSGNHVEARHDGHQDQHRKRVEVYQVEPVEQLRILVQERRCHQYIVIIARVDQRKRTDLVLPGLHQRSLPPRIVKGYLQG